MEERRVISVNFKFVILFTLTSAGGEDMDEIEEEEQLFLTTAYKFLSEISYGRESAPDLGFPHVPTSRETFLLWILLNL